MAQPIWTVNSRNGSGTASDSTQLADAAQTPEWSNARSPNSLPNATTTLTGHNPNTAPKSAFKHLTGQYCG